MINLYLYNLGRWVLFTSFLTFAECESVGDKILADGDVQEYQCVKVENA